MKIILLIFFMASLTVGCSSDEDGLENGIVGEWKLMEFSTLDSESNSRIDYSDENIIYNFKSDNTLVVSGGENPAHLDGQHEYFFGKDFLGEYQEGSKTWVVKIDSTKWTYGFSEGIMIISTSYVDGPILMFKRK